MQRGLLSRHGASARGLFGGCSASSTRERKHGQDLVLPAAPHAAGRLRQGPGLSGSLRRDGTGREGRGLAGEKRAGPPRSGTGGAAAGSPSVRIDSEIKAATRRSPSCPDSPLAPPAGAPPVLTPSPDSLGRGEVRCSPNVRRVPCGVTSLPGATSQGSPRLPLGDDPRATAAKPPPSHELGAERRLVFLGCLASSQLPVIRI